MWLNWSNCSLDDMYRSPLNIWNVSRSSFVSSLLSCTVLELHWTMGTLKARPFFFFFFPDCLCPSGSIWGPGGPACPLLLCDCVSAAWSDVTLRRHYPHHCASLPLCTGNQLWQPWPSNLIGPVTPWPPAIEMVLKSTTITCRPLDYCMNPLTWFIALLLSLLCFFFCSLFPGPLWLECVAVMFFFFFFFFVV